MRLLVIYCFENLERLPAIEPQRTKIRSTMLCLSGFELYSRWVPPNLVFQIYQIYQIPSLCTDSPGERQPIFSEGRDTRNTGNTGNESRPVIVITILPSFSQMEAFKIHLESF